MEQKAKDIMAILGERPVAYNPIYAKLLGDIGDGVILAQLVYWASAMDWQEFHKTDAELAAETGASVDKIKRLRTKLKKYDFIEFARKGTPARMFYVIDPGKLLDALLKIKQNEQKSANKLAQIALTRQCNLHQLDSADCTNIYTENTTENTTDNISSRVKKRANRTKKNQNVDNSVDKRKTNAYEEFLSWWIETAKKTRGIEPILGPADRSQAGRILHKVDPDTLQKLALFYLADYSFRKFAPSIKTFASAGIITGLLNRMKNDPDFWKKLNGYIDQYIKTKSKIDNKAQKELFDKMKKLAQSLTMTDGPPP